MECRDVEKVRPLDELMDDTIKEFDSGEDKECDRDLDKMIWELGDFEDEEPLQDAKEFAEEPPLEDELVEKRRVVGRGGRASFTEDEETEEGSFAGGNLAMAESIASETRRKKKGRAAGGRSSVKKKK
ncbi:MAG: hypothetical protein ACYDAA_04105 [Syntrophales bacterium]